MVFKLLEIWLLIEACLSTAVSGQPFLEERQSNSCPSADYTAENGLTFTTTNLCLHNIPGSDISQEVTANLTECMDLCSAAPASEACFGVSYNIATGKCWMKNSTVLSAPIQESTGTNTALTTNFQTQEDVTCPHSNETEITTSNGMRLQVLCNTNMPVNDYCTLDAPRPRRKVGVCPFHTDTLDECLDICSKSAPLCLGVSWNPDMSSGYGNCYPKSDVSATNYRAARLTAPTSHLAVVVNRPTLATACSSDATVSSSNGTQFDVSCNDNRAGNDLVQVHAETMDACADACATFNNATLGECVASMYDSTLNSGWQNCWLKSKRGTKSVVDGNHLLVKRTSSSESGNTGGGSSGSTGGSSPEGSTGTPSSSGGDSGSTSKAWIAGAVIGPIAGVTLIGFAIWWFRRRRANSYAQQPLEMSADGAPPGYAQSAEKVGPAPIMLHELSNQPKPNGVGSPISQELPANNHPVHELPAK